MDFDQTIAAISTAPGVGAIALVRLSGPQAISIITSLFRSDEKGFEQVELKSHQARHGFIFDQEKNEIADEVMVIAFFAPNSYTGEDVVEISCHGNPILARRILSICLKEGARLAQAGEFTRRAFLSGKIDLTQAEAVLDLIQAENRKRQPSSSFCFKRRFGQAGKNCQGGLEAITYQYCCFA